MAVRGEKITDDSFVMRGGVLSLLTIATQKTTFSEEEQVASALITTLTDQSPL